MSKPDKPPPLLHLIKTPAAETPPHSSCPPSLQLRGRALLHELGPFELLSPERVAVSGAVIRAYAAEATLRRGFRRDSELADTAHLVVVRVTNTGQAAGAHSLLSFVSAPHAGLDGAPMQSLAGFEKVFLDPGQSAEIGLRLTRHDLALARPEGGLAAVEGEWTVRVGDDGNAVVVTVVVG